MIIREILIIFIKLKVPALEDTDEYEAQEEM